MSVESICRSLPMLRFVDFREVSSRFEGQCTKTYVGHSLSSCSFFGIVYLGHLFEEI